MIKTISFQEIEGMVDLTNSNWGSSAKVFNMNENMKFENKVYKNYLCPISLNRKTSRNITYLQHLTNLSKIASSNFMSPQLAVVNPISIVGIIMEKAPGELLYKQNISVLELISINDDIRQSIINISSYFEIFDLNMGSIFFSPKNGITLVDIESYMESNIDCSFANLYRFYTKVVDILQFIPDLKTLIYEELQRGIDYCRLETIYDVVMKYLKQNNLEEKNIRKLLK